MKIALISLCLAVVLVLACSDASKKEDSSIEAAARKVVEQLMHEDYQPIIVQFDSTMKANVDEPQLVSIYESLTSQCGEYDKQGEVQLFHEEPYDIAYVELLFSDMPYYGKVIFNQAGEIAGLRFMPAIPNEESEIADYINPDLFTSRSGKFGDDAWQLPAVVTLPNGPGPFPAVILVQRHGAYDMDETIGVNKPFKDIAGGLSSLGIAVMRYNKRSYAYKDVFDTLSDVTVQTEIIRDIHYAVNLLKRTTGVDSTQIYLLGHGYGGTLLPKVAEQTDFIAGYIALGAPVRPLPDVIHDEVAYIYSQDGDITASEQETLDKLAAQTSLVNDPKLTKEVPREYLPMNMPGSYWYDLKRYDPMEKALIMTEPFLILQAESDYHTTMADFDKWRELLLVRNNVDTRSFPNLNHLFMRGQGKATQLDYMKQGHVDQEVINYIADWIRKPKSNEQ